MGGVRRETARRSGKLSARSVDDREPKTRSPNPALELER